MNPLKHRPAAPSVDDPEPTDWADNWLSNSMAWASQFLTPFWCQLPDHWSAKVSDYLFTDCPCCLLARGFALGVSAALVAVALLSALL